LTWRMIWAVTPSLQSVPMMGRYKLRAIFIARKATGSAGTDVLPEKGKKV
jgi:hypothetical protein